MVVASRMVVRDIRNRYTCVVRLTVKDYRGRLLGPGISVGGIWSKFPDPSPADLWPYKATVMTKNSSTATLAAKVTLSKRVATTCAFSIDSVNVGDWMGSKQGSGSRDIEWSTDSVAKACWDNAGKLLQSCVF